MSTSLNDIQKLVLGRVRPVVQGRYVPVRLIPVRYVPVRYIPAFLRSRTFHP
jgi:hypothetical protein